MILGKSNDAPIYRPMPGTVPFTDQVIKMKDNWVESIENQMNFMMVSVIFNVVTLIMLAIIVTLHIYGRF